MYSFSTYLLDFLSAPKESKSKIEYHKLLPKETWFLIFSFLPAKALCAVAQVSRDWNEMSEEDFLWARVCLDYVMQGGDLFASEGKRLLVQKI